MKSSGAMIRYENDRFWTQIFNAKEVVLVLFFKMNKKVFFYWSQQGLFDLVSQFSISVFYNYQKPGRKLQSNFHLTYTLHTWVVSVYAPALYIYMSESDKHANTYDKSLDITMPFVLTTHVGVKLFMYQAAMHCCGTIIRWTITFTQGRVMC